MFNNKNKITGFTLVEVLVAVFILSTALIGASALVSSNLASTRIIKNNLVGSGLTQEALEVTRNMRDGDWLKISPFGTSLPDGVYRVEWNSSSLISLGADPFLKIASDGKYNYSSGTDTIFKRNVTIESVYKSSTLIGKKITVLVYWNEKSTARQINAVEFLYDWK